MNNWLDDNAPNKPTPNWLDQNAPNFDWSTAAARFGATPAVAPPSIDWSAAAAKYGAKKVDTSALIDSLPDLTQQQPQNALHAGIDALPAISAKSAVDANLPQTLNIAGFDTGIPLSPAIGAGIVGAGKTANDLWAGIKQAGNWATGDTQANAALATQQQQGAAQYAQLQAAHPVASFVGEVAPYVAGLPAATTARSAALIGAAPGAVSYGDPSQRAIAGGVGALGNLGAYGLGKLAAKALGPGSDDAAALANNQWGIPLRAAQVSDSMPVQIVDSVLSSLPGSSGAIQKAKSATLGGFNNAVNQTMGAAGPTITPESIGAARTAAGQAIGSIARRNTMVYDDPLDAAVNAVQDRINNELVGDGQQLAQKQLDRFQSLIAPDNTLPGPLYQAFDSQLGKVLSGNNGSANSVLGDLRTAIRDGMDRSISPDDSQAWHQARHDYFNATQIGNAAKSTPGSLSPAQLLQAVNSAQKNARFGAGNDLADLAQWGKTTLPDLVPNSGTAQRQWYQNMLTNPLSALGGIGAGAYGMDKAGADAKDAALTGLLGIPALYAMGKGVASPALAAYLAKAPVSDTVQRLLQTTGMGLLGAPAMTYRP